MRLFGTFKGRDISAATIAAPDGSITVDVLEYGATIRDCVVTLQGAPVQRVVLGLETLDDYVAHAPHFGAIAGRYANRIRDGRFVLDGVTYQLPKNQDGKHSLHGGGAGFGKSAWTFIEVTPERVVLAAQSANGEHGYPGALTVTCTYTAENGGALSVRLSATTTAPTVINLCQHSYFNLDGCADILDHTLEIRANLMTPVDGDLIPNGSLMAVAGTPYDFRTPRAVRVLDPSGARVPLDNNWVLRGDRTAGRPAGHLRDLALAATLSSATSMLAMDVWTTEPGLQVYDGTRVNVSVPGLNGARYGAASGIALEPQHFPDSPNLPHFPSTVLRPGAVYLQTTVYAFRADSTAITAPRLT